MNDISVPLSRAQWAIAGLILATIVFFSFFRVTQSPPFGFDEGWAVQVATNIADHGADGLQFSPGDIQHVSVLTSVGYTLIYVQAFWFKFFGAGIFQARILMALYMIGFAILAFVLLRRLYGNGIALAALALLVTFPPFYAFGKAVAGEVPLLFFLTLFLLCFNLAMNNPRRKLFWLIAAGLSAGLCVVTKTMALAFAPVLVVGGIIAYKKGLVTWKEIGIVAICAAIPVVVWILVNFQKGDTLASVWDYYSNPSALKEHASTFSRNIRKFFTEAGAIYALGLVIVWIVGIAIRFKKQVRVHTEDYMALIFSLVLLVSFMRVYGDARYLFPIQAMGLMFCPYSIYLILRQRTALFGSLITVLAVAGLYQLSFRSYIADTYKNDSQAQVTRYFETVPESTVVFFYSAPNVVPLFHGANYYQKIVMFEKWVLGSDFATVLSSDKLDMLVLNLEMSKADASIPLTGYTEVATFGKVRILKRKS